MNFTDCLTPQALELWKVIASIMPRPSKDILIETKIEGLPEIDRLMKIPPGFLKEDSP